MTTELCCGATGVVRGCLPRGCRLAARFDRAAGVIRIDSPELDSFSIIVDVSKLHEQSPMYKPTTDELEHEARIVVKYDADAGELRYESPESPEFWLEVDVQQIMQSKRQKIVGEAAGDAGSDEDVYCRNWLKAFACYTDGSAPPLAPRTQESYVRLVPYMKQTIVYYDSQSSLDMTLLQRYLRERLPCAMGRHILTDTRTMLQEFGFDAPLYRSLEAPPPMIGVFTRAPVRVGQDDVDLAIYHMIAPDLCAYADGSPTADLRALVDRTGNAMATDRLMYEAARMHAIAWYMAFHAAHEHGFTKLADVLVGGGAFVPEQWHESFKVKVHDTALYLIGYGAHDFPYPEVELVPPPRVPLRAATGWHDVLHVNAWCHSSFLGNGNRVDGTLDGAWGRSSPIAPFAWPPANPWLHMRAVVVPTPPLVRPRDRTCGKPPSYLRHNPQRP